MSKNKKTLTRVIISFCVFICAIAVFNLTPLKSFKGYATEWQFGAWQSYVYFLPFLTAYFIVGYDVVFKAVRNIFSGKLLDENFLMFVATVGAIALCDLAEAVAVMLFYQVGELFQSYAVGKSRKSIADLMDICPETACVIRDGIEQTVYPEELEVGDTVLIRAGERVPIDGVVIEGEGNLDTSSLTGESVPRPFGVGDEILSGAINLNGAIKIRAEKEFSDCAVAKILDLVENASARKAKAENFITRFAHVYTPAVVIAAVLLAVVPSLFDNMWAVWIERALTFLVVSCPCALVISVPLSFFGGIGGASKKGILIKGGNYMEMLAKTRVFVFDKTGTLTRGAFEVTGVCPQENKDEILRLAAIAESRSLHPIARSIVNYAPHVSADGYTVTEVAGKGVKAVGFGEEILAGNATLLYENGVALDTTQNANNPVYLAKNGVYVGYITVEDAIKPNAAGVIAQLKQSGCKTVMLTGDNKTAAEKVAMAVGVDEYSAQLLPNEKVERVEEFISKKRVGETLCFVGDGINDAPVLSISDVGISMGGIGSDAAIEASDVVLMNDDLSSIPTARNISVKTVKIVKQNIIFALGVKIAVLILSAFGVTGMWLAVFADVGVAVIAILNAMRTLRIK